MAKPGRPSPGLDDDLDWHQRLENREAGGLSIDEFCVDEGVSRSTFYRWVQRLRNGIPDAVKDDGAGLTLAEMAEPKFLPVSVTASPVEIELPDGGLVRLPVGVGGAVIVDGVPAGENHDGPFQLADICLHGADQDEPQLRSLDGSGSRDV